MEPTGLVSPKAAKFRRLGGVATVASLSVEGTVAQLKNEGSTIKSNGIHQYIETGDAKVTAGLKALLLSYLSQETETVYSDFRGEEHEIHNAVTYEDFEKEHPKFTSDQTGAYHANLGAENCLNLYCNMLGNLKIGTNKPDGSPMVYLEKSTGTQPDKDAKTKKEGGFVTAYQSVATETYSKVMQERVIFGFKSANKFGQECTGSATALNLKVAALVAKLFPDCQALSEGVHVLFNWNPHSLFTYHKDLQSEITVIVNLAPARSTFHIAGKEEAEYMEPGDAVVLPSAAWHRSGVAQRRSVKVAYFYKLMKKEEVAARTVTIDQADLPPAGEPPKADTPIAVEQVSGSADPATASSSAADEELKEEESEIEAKEAVSHSTCD
jgi:hypothetical protein